MSRLSFASVPTNKEAVLRDWVRRALGSVDHELRVARVARTLFGLTRSWHGLGASDQRLLGLGALVHDVGRSGGEHKHEHRGARMLLKSRRLPLDAAERRRLAYLTRYHKGRVAQTWEDSLLDRDQDDAVTLRTLLGLLRTADSLDSRSLGAPRLVIQSRGAATRRQLIISGYADDVEQAEEVYGKRKKFRLLEETLDCRIQTQWYGRTALAKVS